LTVNVTNTGAPTPNDPPVVAAKTSSVSEEGLSGGVIDGNGSPDTTNSATVTGQMTATDPDGNAITAWTLEAPTAAITSGGVSVVWTGSGTGTLVGKAGNVEVATLSISSTGAYTFTLKAALDHQVSNTEDLLALGFKALANDGRALGSNTLTINVEDDAPAVPAAQTATAQGQDTNVMVVLDLSTSMKTLSGIGTETRLTSAINSINTLLDKYDALGDVRVRLVTFGTDATTRGDVWTTVDEARKILTGLGNLPPENQGTNYDAALANAIAAYDSAGKLSNAQAVSYFISDGEPTFGNGTTSELTGDSNGDGQVGNTTSGDEGIQTNEEAAWRGFLARNDISSYSLGVGGLTTAQRQVLDPIAYDGRAEEERGGVVVTSLAQLDGVLAATVATPASGNLLSGSFISAVGADGGPYVAAITLNGVTYSYDRISGGLTTSGGISAGTFDAVTKVLTVTSPDGRLIVDMDGGEYRYEVGSSASPVIGFSIADRDGDAVSSTLTINVSKANVVSGTDAGEALNGTAGVDVLAGGDGADTLTGLGSDDKLYGNTGDDVIDGGAGADLLSGGVGADTITGGDGNDQIIGGNGSDVMTGGLGSDVFAWTLADPAATSGNRSNDVIKDFNPAAASAGGDVLDLRDLLSGENYSPTSDNLDRYLDFSVTTANGVATTTIRVSPNGGFNTLLGGDGTYVASQDTHHIVLEGVNIRTALGLATNANDNQIIAKLLSDQKLLIDNS
jgi:large repetitive protein